MSRCDNCVGCPDDAEIHRLCDECMQENIDADDAAMAAKNAEIERLKSALKNVRALAMQLRKVDPTNAAHFLRFCEEAGVVGSVLRGGADV
jgi:hypothetical protein